MDWRGNYNFSEVFQQILQRHHRQDQQMFQLQFMMDQMQEQVQTQFYDLEKHVTNVADATVISVKQQFKQEMKLLKQDVMRAIKEQATEKNAYITTQNLQPTNLNNGSQENYEPQISLQQYGEETLWWQQLFQARNGHLQDSSEQNMPLFQEESERLQQNLPQQVLHQCAASLNLSHQRAGSLNLAYQRARSLNLYHKRIGSFNLPHQRVQSLNLSQQRVEDLNLSQQRVEDLNLKNNEPQISQQQYGIKTLSWQQLLLANNGQLQDSSEQNMALLQEKSEQFQQNLPQQVLHQTAGNLNTYHQREGNFKSSYQSAENVQTSQQKTGDLKVSRKKKRNLKKAQKRAENLKSSQPKAEELTSSHHEAKGFKLSHDHGNVQVLESSAPKEENCVKVFAKSYSEVVKTGKFYDNSFHCPCQRNFKTKLFPGKNIKYVLATERYAEGVFNKMMIGLSSLACADEDILISSKIKGYHRFVLLMTIKPKDSIFDVNISENFILGTKMHASPFMYIKGTSCKVSMQIIFGTSGRLEVQALVSKCDKDEKQIWPLIIKGTGSIFNFESAKWIKIWQIWPVICAKPQFSEHSIVFPADVCLRYSRHDYLKTPTMTDLVTGAYATENVLVFKWHLMEGRRQGGKSRDTSQGANGQREPVVPVSTIQDNAKHTRRRIRKVREGPTGITPFSGDASASQQKK